MTSKERVLATINHQEPDRIPIGEWGIDHDHVENILGIETSLWRNRRLETIYLWENRRDELVESMVRDYSALIDKLDYDIITVSLVPPKTNNHTTPPRKIAEGQWEDDNGNQYKYSGSNDSITKTSHAPGIEELTDDELSRVAETLAKPFDPSQFELIDEIAEKYGNEKALLSRDIDVFNILLDPFGGDFSHKLILPMTHPQEIQKLFPYALERQKRLIKELKKRQIIIGMQGHDFCMNTGCMYTPDSLRNLFFPFQKMITHELQKENIYPFFHCCGNTWDILNDYVEAGWVAYQSIQKSAGMDWAKLKAEYGNILTLWAGISCETLIEGSSNEVVNEVEEALDVLPKGGGFIFGSTNSVQYGAKTENYLQALEIAKKFRY